MVQTNYLSDNDVATQISANSHYNLIGGHNQLGNVALIVDGEIQYDLIIIQGSYHGMNVIFQNNILLNNDNIVVSAEGAGPSQSVELGHNSLSNEGAIENYGGDDFREMIPGLKLIEGLLAAGATSIDPELGAAIAGNGPALRVLYVTGDYYDVNAVWQTNITSDVNVMYQLQNEPSADLVALHPDENLTQSVNTGNNQLSNDAAIVDVNPDVIYVEGDVYSDSILVQADLLPTDQDAAVNADTDTLITEPIAFVDDNQDQTCARRSWSHSRCRLIRWRVCCIRGKAGCFGYFRPRSVQMSSGGNDRLGRVASPHPEKIPAMTRPIRPRSFRFVHGSMHRRRARRSNLPQPPTRRLHRRRPG